MLISFNKFKIFLEILEGKNMSKLCCYDTKIRNNWTLKMSVKFISSVKYKKGRTSLEIDAILRQSLRIQDSIAKWRVMKHIN